MTAHDVRPARRRDLAGDALAWAAPTGAVRDEERGWILVAGDPVVGFVHVLDLESHAHLSHVSVHSDHGRRGIGGALLEAAAERAALKGHGSLTLTTRADLPWNVPFYVRHGFVEVPDDEPRTSTQLAIMAEEEQLGLVTHGRRIWMRRALQTHRSTEELVAFLPALDDLPHDVGTLRAVIRRPTLGQREVLDVGQLDVDRGLVGDTWAERGSRRTDDGAAHPDMQLNIMTHALVAFLAGDEDREQLAGDQMFVDLDLSHDNLPAWSELHIGGPEGAVVVATDQPHNGCAKFIARYGKDAMTFVNGPEGKPRRLRGLCARVVQPGAVRPGDRVVVTRP